MQENQVDPIGLGARQFEKEKISEEEWYNAFQQMDVHVKVDVKIVESGVSNNSIFFILYILKVPTLQMTV